MRRKKKRLSLEGPWAPCDVHIPALHTVGWVRTLRSHGKHFRAEGMTWDGTQE
jgi:hypothetical protein